MPRSRTSPHPPWSDEELAALRELYPKGGTAACKADPQQRLVNRSANAIRVTAVNYAISSARALAKLTPEQKELAVQLRAEHKLSVEQIARRLKVKRTQLRWLFLKKGAELGDERLHFIGTHGRRAEQRSFTREEDALILMMRKAGKGPTAIGRTLKPPRRASTVYSRLTLLDRRTALRERAMAIVAAAAE